MPDATTGGEGRAEDVPVYIAGKLKEARKVEEVLEAGKVAYRPRHQRYAGFLFGAYDGVAFDVSVEDRDRALDLLRSAGLKSGLQG